VTPVLATVGDLVEDVAVRLAGPIAVATDTDALIERRRGGSAANVAAAAARITGGSRLLAQVGDDALGDRLLAELADEGVDTGFVRRRGRTGSIVVLVDSTGERSFLTDAGDGRALDGAQESWLDGIDVLHVPLYSFVGGAIASTVSTLVRWAHRRSIAVSIDLSSGAVIDALGAEETRALVDQSQPAVVFANADEATRLGIDGALGSALTVVKRGGQPVIVHRPGLAPIEVAAQEIGDVADTTGAGDAFAAGFLSYRAWRDDPAGACRAGHAAAAALLRKRNAS
jgi:sugar/nucleoside kinase (ribokinase family)